MAAPALEKQLPGRSSARPSPSSCAVRRKATTLDDIGHLGPGNPNDSVARQAGGQPLRPAGQAAPIGARPDQQSRHHQLAAGLSVELDVVDDAAAYSRSESSIWRSRRSAASPIRAGRFHALPPDVRRNSGSAASAATTISAPAERLGDRPIGMFAHVLTVAGEQQQRQIGERQDEDREEHRIFDELVITSTPVRTIAARARTGDPGDGEARRFPRLLVPAPAQPKNWRSNRRWRGRSRPPRRRPRTACRAGEQQPVFAEGIAASSAARAGSSGIDVGGPNKLRRAGQDRDREQRAEAEADDAVTRLVSQSLGPIPPRSRPTNRNRFRRGTSPR
jgi:hypothetical protein